MTQLDEKEIQEYLASQDNSITDKDVAESFEFGYNEGYKEGLRDAKITFSLQVDAFIRKDLAAFVDRFNDPK